MNTMLACVSCIFNCKSEYDEPVETDARLQLADFHNTKAYIPIITYGKVIKVYDGDTITIAAYLPESDEQVYKFSVRLRGIDSAEIRGSSPTEKQHAIVARDALHAKIFNKYVKIDNVATEKYGRLLSDVYFEDCCINEWMLTNNYAVKYEGGTKVRDIAWDKPL